MEGGLDAQIIYDPPNLTYPYGAYIAVVDIDPETAQVTVRRFIAVDDCGVRINPMIVDGQIHGGLAEGIGIALMELISFDEEGNCLNSSFMDYLIPTAMECPEFELGETVTPCPHHPLGAKGVGESPNVGSPPAIVNAVIDALRQGYPRRRPHRHAVHPRPRVGGDAGPAGAAAVISADLDERLRDLRAHGEPFVTATVVRVAAARPARRPATSRWSAATATIEGFVGGVCAQHSVRLYSLQAIETRRAAAAADHARRARATPTDPVADDGATSTPGQEIAREDGAVTVRNPASRGVRSRCSWSRSCRRRACWSPATRRSSSALKRLGAAARARDWSPPGRPGRRIGAPRPATWR